MFNNKVIAALANVIAILLLLKAILVIVIFVWGYYGTPPVMIFDPRLPQENQVLLFIQELGTIAFFYIFLGVLKGMLMHHGKHECKKEMASPAVRPAVKRAASRPRRRTTKKK